MPAIRDTSDRRQQISIMVKERGSVQVAALAKQFTVSMQTIRKDLNYLGKRGITARSYGGAILAEAVSVFPEPPVEAKRSMHAEEKRRIGRLAAAMVVPGDSIVLDSGTTNIQIAYHLPDSDDITVLTNDFGVLAALVQKKLINIVMLGGVLRRKNMAFYGGQTVSAFDDLHVDKLFLGVDGFDLDRGITTHHEPEAMLNRKMAQAARKIIAVTDSSKFDHICLHRIIDIRDVDALVTDEALPAHIRTAAADMGYELHIA
jgi:DeoR family transcriptional regulator, aga operon transcriptional repressor